MYVSVTSEDFRVLGCLIFLVHIWQDSTDKESPHRKAPPPKNKPRKKAAIYQCPMWHSNPLFQTHI